MIALAADCSRCAALCCVALAFDRGGDFGIDKSAGQPCPHLDRHHCTIHDRLPERGFTGCQRYDCLGAGQRVVQEVFAGQSWQDDPRLLAPMMRAFAGMRSVHQKIELLRAAARLPLTPDDEAQRQTLLARLEAPWDSAMLGRFPDAEGTKIDRFIRTLARYLPHRAQHG